MHEHVGKMVKFEDGKTLRLHQIKKREDGEWAIFEINEGGSIPRRLTANLYEFSQKFGKFFEDK